MNVESLLWIGWPVGAAVMAVVSLYIVRNPQRARQFDAWAKRRYPRLWASLERVEDWLGNHLADDM